MWGGGANSAPLCLSGSPKEQGCVASYGRDVRSKPTLVGYNSILDIGALMTESSMVGLLLDFLLYVLFLEAVKYVL